MSTARQALAQAEDDLDTAQDAMDAFNQRIADGYYRNNERDENPGATFDTVELAALRAGVNKAEQAVADARRDLAELLDGPDESDRTAAQSAVTDLEITLEQQQRELAELEAGPDESDRTAAESRVTELQTTLELQNRQLAELAAGPKATDRTAVQTQVTQQEADLNRLKRQLAELDDGPDADELARLESAVALARERLDRAERELADASEGVDQVEQASLQAAADQARVALQSAQSRLARLEKGPDQATLDGLTKDVATAQQARDDLAETAGAADLALAQANIDAAAAAYDRALADVDKTMLLAPFDGIVRLVTIAPGEAAALDVRAIQIVDPYDVTVLGLVESNYIDRITAQSTAAVTLAAMPDQVFTAQVAAISETARTERGIISFPVRFNLTIPPGATPPPLHPGLVTVTIRE